MYNKQERYKQGFLERFIMEDQKKQKAPYLTVVKLSIPSLRKLFDTMIDTKLLSTRDLSTFKDIAKLNAHLQKYAKQYVKTLGECWYFNGSDESNKFPVKFLREEILNGIHVIQIKDRQANEILTGNWDISLILTRSCIFAIFNHYANLDTDYYFSEIHIQQCIDHDDSVNIYWHSDKELFTKVINDSKQHTNQKCWNDSNVAIYFGYKNIRVVRVPITRYVDGNYREENPFISKQIVYSITKRLALLYIVQEEYHHILNHTLRRLSFILNNYKRKELAKTNVTKRNLLKTKLGCVTKFLASSIGFWIFWPIVFLIYINNLFIYNSRYKQVLFDNLKNAYIQPIRLHRVDQISEIWFFMYDFYRTGEFRSEVREKIDSISNYLRNTCLWVIAIIGSLTAIYKVIDPLKAYDTTIIELIKSSIQKIDFENPYTNLFLGTGIILNLVYWGYKTVPLIYQKVKDTIKNLFIKDLA